MYMYTEVLEKNKDICLKSSGMNPNTSGKLPLSVKGLN